MSDSAPVPPGRYRHYKGREYSVIGTARHSETLEELVVYRREADDRSLWVRPRTMFSELVTVDGREVPRFEPLPSKNQAVEPGLSNLFDAIPQALPREIVQTLLQAVDVRIERIISYGQASPSDFWYDQAQAEWVVVLAGAARLQFEDRMVDMQVGDFINIPAFQKHRVDWTTPDQPTIWLGVRYSDPTSATTVLS